MAQRLAATSFWALTTLVVVIGLFNCPEDCSAEPISCPTDLEASLRDAFKACSEQIQKLESKALLGIANISIGLLKESPLVEKVVGLIDEVHSEEQLDETKLKRNVNVSLLKEAPAEIRHLLRAFKDNRRRRDSGRLEKEVRELVVCAVEKLMQDEPVLKKAIEDCHPGEGKEDEVSQAEFENCVATSVKQMCPNLKLD